MIIFPDEVFPDKVLQIFVENDEKNKPSSMQNGVWFFPSQLYFSNLKTIENWIRILSQKIESQV